MTHELTAHEAVSAVVRDLEAELPAQIITDMLFVTAFARLAAETRNHADSFAIAEKWAAVRATPAKGE